MRLLIILVLWCFCLQVLAKPGKMPEDKSIEPDAGFQWNWVFSFSTLYHKDILVGADPNSFYDYLGLNIGLELYYRGFYLQAGDSYRLARFSQAELGYELVSQPDYDIDLVIGQSYLNGFSDQVAGNRLIDKIPELEGITERNSDFSQAIRYRRKYDNAAWWIDIGHDHFADYHGGWLIEAYYSYMRQVRNWDMQFGVGVTHFSGKMVNYFYGVRQHEIRPDRPAYQAGSANRLMLEIAAMRPLSENWLLGLGGSSEYYSSTVSDSPLVKRPFNFTLKATIRYVF